MLSINIIVGGYDLKQLLQSLKDGKINLISAPCPKVKKGCLLIASRATVISVGTEKILVDFGRSGMIARARSHPDRVKQIMDKVKTDGFFPTLTAVQSKLNRELPLGYCNAGTVIDIGEGVEGFMLGDRVVSNGPHAEIVMVPKNLCIKIPEEVTDIEAAFTVLGSIALQGIRLIKPTLGETFAVTGLGIVGLLTVQILLANGCKVLGIDKDSYRVELAKDLGAFTVDLSKDEDPIYVSKAITGGRGIDGSIITTATNSNQPVQQATKMCRKRGRIVLVGVAGLELDRADFYKKELSFQVSCSYGPGRYDPNYEEKGQDYPIGYVRWTEHRNFEAILELMALKKLAVKPLITHCIPFEKAPEAYEMISQGKEKYLGIVLEYTADVFKLQTNTIVLNDSEIVDSKKVSFKTNEPVVGFIGAGNFSEQVLLPALISTNAQLKSICSSGALSAARVGKKYGFYQCCGNAVDIINDNTINTVFIASRHDTHTDYVIQALRAGKNVFVEKPLSISESELNEVVKYYKSISDNEQAQLPIIMVGFNRRFSPYINKILELLKGVNCPKSIVINVNAGNIPEDHWIQNLKTGGGRIIGEACHFIDLARYLINSKIINYSAISLNDETADNTIKDTVIIQLAFEDGSIANLNYFSNGNKAYPKEGLEVYCGGQIIKIDNFKRMDGYGVPGFKKMKTAKQEKGHNAEVAAFIDAVRKGGQAPISFSEIEEVTRVSILLDKMVRER